jgi:peptidase E
VSFLGTAGGDADACLLKFYTAFSRSGCRLSHLPLFKRVPPFRDYLMRQDVIYVGGGNTKSMLAVWRDWGLPELLREAWEAGVILAGVSAGAICWFEQAVVDSYAEGLAVSECLGFLSGSCCPHYNSEPERRPVYHRLLLRGEITPGTAIDDGAAVHFAEGEIHRVVASEPGATAYRVRLMNGSVQEEPVSTDCLSEGASG